jgi:alpha-galactosidase
MRQGADELPLFEVRQAGVSVSFMLVIPGTPYVSVRYAGRIAGDALDLASIDEDGGKYTLTARRVARSNPVSAPVAEATPPAIETSPSAPAEPVPERQTALLTPEARSSPPEPAITEPPMPEAAPPLAAEPKIATLEPPAPVAEAPPPPPVLRGTNPLGAPAKPAGPATLKGRWTAEQKGPGSAAPVEAALSFDGSSGSMRVGEDDWPLFDVKQTGSDVGFTLVIPGTPYITIHYRGMLMGDAFTVASIDEGQMGFTIDARREGSDARPPAPRVASLNPPLPRPAPRRAASPAAPPPSEVPVVAPPTVPDIAPPSPTKPVPEIASVAPPVELPLRGTQPIAPSPPAPMPMPEAGPSLDLIPALREPPPMPEVASAAPPPEPAPPPHERYTPPPLSTAPVAKLPLPSLRDVAPSMALKVPPMGWASRERLGTMIDDQAIRQAADGLEETGLKAVGFTYVEVDDGWQGERDESGTLHSNPEFPDMKALGDYIHAKGLKFGLMTSAAPQSCAGYTGSYGHEAEDAKTFASWGVDILVYDWCGAENIYSSQPEMQAAYQKMGEALRASGRDIAFEIAGNGQFEVANWGSRTSANLWRTAEDLEDKFSSVMDAGFAVTGAPSRNGQRGWNDPGLLQTGNGGMTTDEYRAQINLWAVLGAPMMLGNDVRIMRRETVDLLSNKEVLAINQDALGRQGIRISPLGNTGVWAKPLSNGAVAVLFVNRSNASAPAAVSWEQLGIMGPMQVRDVWWHEDIGMANNRYAVFLTAHTSLLLILSPEP